MYSRICDVQREPSAANCFQNKRDTLWDAEKLYFLFYTFFHKLQVLFQTASQHFYIYIHINILE